MNVQELGRRYPQLIDGRNMPPDAVRYFVLADGGKVPRPFHLRWLLPAVLGTDKAAWRACWAASWVVLIGSMIGWQLAEGADWRVALAAAALLSGLPGIAGSPITVPVGVDIPATAVGVCAVMFTARTNPGWIAAVVLLSLAAGSIKETTPVWIALWAWSPLPLIGLAAPLIRSVLYKPGPDPIGGKFQEIADHPIRTALAARKGQWRDAWVMVAPWGACLAALHDPSLPVVVVVVVAYLQLLVATDTVRLVQHAAGPALAVAAAHVIPVAWLPVAVVLHAVWWWQPRHI